VKDVAGAPVVEQSAKDLLVGATRSIRDKTDESGSAEGGLGPGWYPVATGQPLSMPRASLRRAQPLVRQFCADRGIDYAQCGLLKTYYYVLQYLHDASAPLREKTAPAR
jgi:hypothetical protein